MYVVYGAEYSLSIFKTIFFLINDCRKFESSIILPHLTQKKKKIDAT